MKNSEQINHLARHALATLPDSLAARKQLLIGVVAVLPKGTELQQRVVTMLTHLTAHERCQAQLKF